MAKIDAAILTGGKSSRMGQNKALLNVDGVKMIERVLKIAEQVCGKCFLVTNTPREYDFLNLPCYPDIIKNVGPLGGIHAALSHASSSQCLIVACDLPFLSVDLLVYICENAAGHDIFVVDTGKRMETLCAVYSKNCIAVIESQIALKKYAVHDLLKKVQTKVVRCNLPAGISTERGFENVNTPADLLKANRVNTCL